MPFKDVYFELEPFEANTGAADSLRSNHRVDQIAKGMRVDDDDWVEQMCRQDADQFLSSIQKSSKISRSPICSSELFKTTRDDNRDDVGYKPRCEDLVIPRTIRNTDHRDEEANIGKREGQKKQEKVGPVSLPQKISNRRSAQNQRNVRNPNSVKASGNSSRDQRGNYHVSSTESSRIHAESTESPPSAQRNKYYMSSTESSRSHVESSGSHDSSDRNKYYVSSTGSSESHVESCDHHSRDLRGKYYVSSTESSGSHASSPRNRYISSAESSWSSVSPPSTPPSSPPSTNSSTERQEQKGGKEQRSSESLNPPSPATKLILDDLIDLRSKISLDLKTKIENGLTKKEIGKIPEFKGTTKNAHLERPLWKLLSERHWERAKHRVRLHPEEARQKIKLPNIFLDIGSNNNEDSQRMEESSHILAAFPLHLACSVRPLPPTALLEDLITAYPEACQQFEESSGLLPIHLVANLKPVVRFRLENGEERIGGESPNRKLNRIRPTVGNEMQHYEVDSPNHESVINLLLTAYPYSISVREGLNGMTPLHIAASTTRAENGIVSPVASNVLRTLMVKSPFDAVHFWKDKNGMTPYDWAWQNVEINQTENAGRKFPKSLSVAEVCLHPFLRKEIRDNISDSADSTMRLEPNKKDVVLPTQTRKAKLAAMSPQRVRPSPPPTQEVHPQNAIVEYNPNFSELQENNAIISPSELNNIREYANTNMAFRQMTCNKEALGTGKSATLQMTISLSELIHPSNHGRRRTSGRSSKFVPNPFLEVFAAHRRGMSKSYYKSYPLHGCTEGTWEDVFLDLGLTHKQLRNGTNGAGYIEVGIRVMNCPENGSKVKLIGTCQVSLESLEKQQAERLKLQEEIRNLKNMLGDGREVEMALPEPEKYPVLKGFEVVGKLQVAHLAIE